LEESASELEAPVEVELPELEEEEAAEVVEEAEVEVEVEVGVSVVEVVVGALVLLELLLLAELVETDTVSLEEPPEVSKTTMLALAPEGTVTTQPVAPPAPVKTSGASISFTPMVEGSIRQGRPLQPLPSQRISIPNSGLTSRKGVAGSR
jgi:hypothetical protein